MSFKIIFENEMHRSSSIPDQFQYFSSYLFNTFRSKLPSPFWLYYVTPTGQQLPLSNDEDYQNMKKIQSEKPIKIFITDRQPDLQAQERKIENVQDYEVIPQCLDADNTEEAIIQEERKEQDVPLLQPSKNDQAIENIINDVAKAHLETEISDKTQELQMKSVVIATIEEHMPIIIAKVKEVLIKEGLVKQEQPRKPSQNPWQKDGYHPSAYVPPPQQHIQQAYPVAASYPVMQGPIPVNNQGQYQGQAPVYSQGQNQGQVPIYNQGQYQGQIPVYNQGQYQMPPPRQNVPQQNEKNDFFAWVENAVNNIPSKAAEMFDNFNQNLEGDPYVHCAEGKYRKSTIEKVQQLREVFPDEEKKKLLDFTEKYPKNVPVDQIASVYASMQQPENR